MKSWLSPQIFVDQWNNIWHTFNYLNTNFFASNRREIYFDNSSMQTDCHFETEIETWNKVFSDANFNTYEFTHTNVNYWQNIYKA